MTKRKAGLCSLCMLDINEGEECFMYYSSRRKDGKVHFRHLLCQYDSYVQKKHLDNKKPLSFDGYMDNIRAMVEGRKKNKLIQKDRERALHEYPDQLAKCPNCGKIVFRDKLDNHIERCIEYTTKRRKGNGKKG